MLRTIMVIAGILTAVPALADECRPSGAVLTRLDNLNAKHAVYDGDALKRAGRIYAAMPPMSAEPAADHLIVADLPTGSVVLLFLTGSDVCATMMIPDTRAAALAKEFILGLDV